uniref:Putative ovule protein n=1 Tax=Solanum chacoense TaxID=4108 RepID=A0A0V0HW64_SOLCH
MYCGLIGVIDSFLQRFLIEWFYRIGLHVTKSTARCPTLDLAILYQAIRLPPFKCNILRWIIYLKEILPLCIKIT